MLMMMNPHIASIEHDDARPAWVCVTYDARAEQVEREQSPQRRQEEPEVDNPPQQYGRLEKDPVERMLDQPRQAIGTTALIAKRRLVVDSRRLEPEPRDDHQVVTVVVTQFQERLHDTIGNHAERTELTVDRRACEHTQPAKVQCSNSLRRGLVGLCERRPKTTSYPSKALL